MKIEILLTAFVVFICDAKPCRAQDNTGAIRQRISVKEFQGKTIELTASAKANPMEKTAAAVLFFIVQKENKQAGNLIYSQTPITVNDWNTYSLSGKLDKDADSLSFGVIFRGKGIFSFDDFHLTIDKKAVSISDNNFETFRSFPNTAWSASRLPNDYIVSISNESVFEGKASLVIDGSAQKKLNRYGDNDSTGKFADVNGIKLYYETYGAGEPLILLHGNQQSIEAFTNQIPEFSKSYKVIAIDTRGQGKSSTNSDTYTYDLFASDVNGLLDKLGLDSANVVGWSDGGNTGLILAMKYPARVKKLVTMGANVFIDKTVVDNKIIKEVSKGIDALSNDTSGQAVNSKRLYTLLLTEPKHSFDDLKTIACPVLVMAGEKDIIKEEHSKGIAAHIAHSRLFIAPKQTHEYPVENPKSFNEVVLDFLKTNQ
jgi:pimeloyl-ACP methyl ester carboxylesterase